LETLAEERVLACYAAPCAAQFSIREYLTLEIRTALTPRHSSFGHGWSLGL
jgi:hypothetical protein